MTTVNSDLTEAWVVDEIGAEARARLVRERGRFDTKIPDLQLTVLASEGSIFQCPG